LKDGASVLISKTDWLIDMKNCHLNIKT
jgi:hypothetical protein